MTFDRIVSAAVESTALYVSADLAFEHLAKPVDEVWDFAMACALDKTADHVASFVAKHQRHVTTRFCFIPIEHLKTAEPWTLADVTFLPVQDPTLPTSQREFSMTPAVGSVARIEVTGTSLGMMAERARAALDRTLRVLRASVGSSGFGLHDGQLRFRYAESYAFSDDAQGWSLHRDRLIELDANPALLERTMGSPLLRLAAAPANDMSHRGDLALCWLEREALTGDPLVCLLFSFFALEAVLGDKAEGLKADALAVRQMALDHHMTGGFHHPAKVWNLYDGVRSAAVHGSEAPDVMARESRRFRDDVVTTLEQCLTVSEEKRFTSKSQLLSFLDRHPDMPELSEWLLEHSGPGWRPYLDQLLGPSKT